VRRAPSGRYETASRRTPFCASSSRVSLCTGDTPGPDLSFRNCDILKNSENPSTTVSRMSDPGEITRLLAEWNGGNRAALDSLVRIVYDELRHLASSYMRGERPDHMLQTTALVNEAYLRLVERHHVSCQTRTQFFAIAAQVMRRVRYFGGLSVEEVAETLNVSDVTVARDWKMAKMWLRREIAPGSQHAT
jgi:hypothetical protein